MLALILALALNPAPNSEPCKPTAANSEISQTISGRVTDPTDAPIKGAQVMLKPIGGGSAAYTIASADGCFEFTAKPGSYSLKARAEAFENISQNVILGASQTATVTLRLPVGGCTQCVTMAETTILTVCAIDSKRLPALNAHVNLRSKSLSPSRFYDVTMTDDWGCTSINVFYGDYKLTIEAKGFKSVGQNLKVHVGVTQGEWVKMTPRTAAP